MSIKVIKKNGNTTYNVLVRIRSKLDTSIRVAKLKNGIKDKSEAQRTEKLLRDEAIREIYQQESQGILWKDLVIQYSNALEKNIGLQRPVQKTTAIDNSRALEIYTHSLMNKPANSITKMDVRWILDAAKEDGKSNGRIKSIKGAINGCFIWGVDNGLLPSNFPNPCIGIKIGRFEEKKPSILNHSEITTLLREAKRLEHPFYTHWVVALYTGMRSGELFALEWTDVDFETKKINIDKSYNGRLKAIKSTKANYWREVPISPELEIILKELKLRSKGSTNVLPRNNDWKRGEAARVLRQFCLSIGITPINFHALRACFATQILRAGGNMAVVQKMCGWKDLKVTQRYIRLAGIEITGATDSLKFISPSEAQGEVIQMFKKGTNS